MSIVNPFVVLIALLSRPIRQRMTYAKNLVPFATTMVGTIWAFVLTGEWKGFLEATIAGRALNRILGLSSLQTVQIAWIRPGFYVGRLNPVSVYLYPALLIRFSPSRTQSPQFPS
ncbi:hypothetical protein [Microvirga rosea]|uniref:hypothetical protein n=1 Tax=Microvirga rosea TaxID=2715425 RepID=UPI001D0B75E7|nr:hypothetical protein [Microvirga rosea]MCB8821994.1 hypothetical protein [Microvirga rosea]